MTARKSAAAGIPASSASATRSSAGRRLAGAAALGVAALAAAGVLAGGGTSPAGATVLTNCAAKPSGCSYPDATNTGVPAGTTLKQVPAQATSGTGWSYNATTKTVVVSVKGTVLSGLSITGTLQVNAANVTVKDVKVVSGGNFGIELTHTTGVTIENSTISGQNATTGRVSYAIDDVYADSTGMTLNANNISDFRTAVQMSTGLAENNYIHDPGYIAGDHTNGFYVGGGTQSLTIQNNTIFDSLGQTDAINLDAPTPGPNAPVANKTIKNNLLAGGGYTIYAGAIGGNTTSGIVITGNRFGQNYYAKSGQYGPAAYYAAGTGNTWSANLWDSNGQTIPSP